MIGYEIDPGTFRTLVETSLAIALILLLLNVAMDVVSLLKGGEG